MASTPSSLSPIQRFWGLLKPDRQEIFSIYIYAIFNGLVNLSLPLGIQAIINFVSGGQMSTTWLILVAFVIAGIGIGGVMQVMQLTIVENLQRKIFTRSAFEFSYRIPKMKWESLGKYYPPELINRFFDTLTIQKGLSKILIDLPTATLQILFGFILLSFYHPFFIVFSLILVSVLALIFAFSVPSGLKSSLKESKYKYEVAFWLEEVARTMQTFKLAGHTNLPLKKTDENVQNYLQARKSHFRILVFQFFNLIGFKMIISGALLILGGVLVMDQRLNIGQFVAAEILIVLMINSIEKVILSMENIYDVLTAVEKLGYVMDLPLEEEKGVEIPSIKNGMDIQVSRLGFRFPHSEKNSLNDVSFEIKAGEKICILGESGSGKSILLQLISGLYPEFEGAISYNRIPLGNLNLHFIRDLISYSFAKESIFKGTIAENITVGKEHHSLESIQKAAEITGLSEFITESKEGYATELLPEGRTLSGTVVNQITMARCVVGNPPVMILENNVTSLSEKNRQTFLQHILAKSNPSTVIIAMDKTLEEDIFDRYFVMKNGVLVFQGGYSEALAHFETGKRL